MKTSPIAEVSIDDQGRLRVVPRAGDFTFVWRAAGQVYWDDAGRFLYSPRPREWTYLRWYIQIVGMVASEYGVVLRLDHATRFSNVPAELQHDIAQWDATEAASQRLTPRPAG